MTKNIGRFEILRELGRGAQSVVYLARDPHLQREVAIKTLHLPGANSQQNTQLLDEARTVGQLRHPNIVPIFEAGEDEGQVYLVFEYVDGRSLGEALKAGGRMTPVKAVAVLQPILDALAHAHEAGVIHRDLKPSNILIGENGVPRVMDFGIAARVESPAETGGELHGTPAYMAPEYITRHEISARNDLFAAGLVFFELLFGRRAAVGTDPFEVMNFIANEDISLPADGSVALDDRLADILYKALARDPALRFTSVAQMCETLDAYVQPEDVSSSTDVRQSTIDFLLRRMRHKSDFPALSESVSAINKMTTSEKESISQLSTTILKDFSLTNKILRLVNAAHYRQASGGNISTVSRAVIVLGFDAVRNIAITVLLFEHLQNKGNVNQLKDEFLRANFAGILARDIGAITAQRDIEQAFICSMFHNLGRLLSHYYFPEETDEIKRLVAQKSCTEEAAAQQALGISFEELGIGIARTWGFPPLIINSMRKLPPGGVRKSVNSEERLRVLSAFANELCTIIAEATPETRQKELRKMAARFGESVSINEPDLRKTVEKSFEQMTQFAGIIRLNLQQTSFGRQMNAWLGRRAGASEADETATGESGSILGDSLAAGSPASGSYAPGSSEAAEAVLTAGIQDISNTLVEDFKLNDVLRIILETMYRAKGFKRVVLCIRDARSNTMVGRFGFGPDAMEIAKRFVFPLTFQPDVFHAAISKNVDILLSDTNDPKIAARIPDWFRKGVGAGTFVIFPLCIKAKPVAMIYADQDKAGDIVISEKELSLLRTLRNQAVLAIKQQSG